MRSFSVMPAIIEQGIRESSVKNAGYGITRFERGILFLYATGIIGNLFIFAIKRVKSRSRAVDKWIYKRGC